jgi:transposase
MPGAFPMEFRRDVVAVARRKQAPMSQIAKDFAISESCLHRWVKRAEIEDGVRDGLTLADEAEIRELKKRNRLLEQENEVLRRAGRNHGLRPRTGSRRMQITIRHERWTAASGSRGSATRSRFCNVMDVGWRTRIRTMLEKNPTMSFEQIAGPLNKKVSVHIPPKANPWTAELAREAYTSLQPCPSAPAS